MDCAPILVALWIWEPPIKLWSCPKLCVGLVTALKSPIVDRVFHLGGRARGDYGEPPCWGALCLHTAPTEISTRKGVNFGIHRCLRVPRLFLYPSSFTYAIYSVIAFVLEVIYILLSHSFLSCLA
jgi:hypothetical protein